MRQATRAPVQALFPPRHFLTGNYPKEYIDMRQNTVKFIEEALAAEPPVAIPSKEARSQAEQIARVQASSLVESRLDMRSATTVTFVSAPNEPAQCAFTLETAGGLRRLGVHVSDVSMLICPGTPLDDEARAIGEYYPAEDEQRGLFPHSLIVDTFNLIPGRDRITQSVLLDYDSDGNLVKMECDETVVRVDKCCLFSEIDLLETSNDRSAVLALRKKYSNIAEKIDEMYALAAQLRQKRRERGGLILPQYVGRIKYSETSGKPLRFLRRPEPDSKTMLRELYIESSRAAGEMLHSHRLPALYTNRAPHSRPFLKAVCRAVGLPEPVNERVGSTATAVLESAAGRECEALVADVLRFNLPTREFATRPGYNVLTGTVGAIEFTKPLLRYSDLVNHRILKEVIKVKKRNKISPSRDNGRFNIPRVGVRALVRPYAEDGAALCSEIVPLRRAAALARILEERLSVLSIGSPAEAYFFAVDINVGRMLLSNGIQAAFRGDVNSLRPGELYDVRVVRLKGKCVVETF